MSSLPLRCRNDVPIDQEDTIVATDVDNANIDSSHRCIQCYVHVKAAFTVETAHSNILQWAERKTEWKD